MEGSSFLALGLGTEQALNGLYVLSYNEIYYFFNMCIARCCPYFWDNTGCYFLGFPPQCTDNIVDRAYELVDEEKQGGITIELCKFFFFFRLCPPKSHFSINNIKYL